MTESIFVKTSPPSHSAVSARFNLLRYFTWSSLLVIATVFVASAFLGAYVLHNVFLGTEREDADEIAMDFVIQMRSRGYPVRQWFSAAAQPELRSEMEQKVKNLGITEFTILAPDGHVLETFGSVETRREQLWDEGFERARKGEVSLHWESVHWGPLVIFSSGERGLVETYIPIRADDGSVVSIIKIRRNLAKVMDQNHRSLPALILVLTLAAGLVFTALWFVIRKAQRIILSQQQQIAQANSQLEEHNRRLEDLNNRKDEFLAICSHDLRSPLTSVSLGCSILLRESADKLSPTQRDIIQRSKRSTETIVQLVDRLLDVARIEAGIEVADTERCDLAKIVEESTALHAAQAQTRGVSLEVHAPKELPLLADRMKLLRVCNNLLSNAVKHSPPGKIRIDVAARDGWGELSIKDEGPGISREDQATIFDRFSALSRRKKTRTDGTGLGLFITRALVELHGGKIDVESEPGCGATFRVRLPLDRLAPVERAAIRKEPSHA